MYHQAAPDGALPSEQATLQARDASSLETSNGAITHLNQSLRTLPTGGCPIDGNGSMANGIVAGGDPSTKDKYRCEIRVYKKSSLNGKLTVYIGKRDFVDHMDHVDPIDGVVLIDRDYLRNRRVFGHVLATFSYGRDDLDVLGLTFRKELYLVNEQIFPDLNRSHNSPDCPYFIDGVTNLIQQESSNNTNSEATTNNLTITNGGDQHFECQPSTSRQDLPSTSKQSNTINNNNTSNRQPYGAPMRPLTRLQERLVRKLGKNAFPFYFELPPLSPSSVTLQPGPGENGKPCGVDYELKVYVASSLEEKPSKHDSIRLAIRKIMYAPSKQGEQPMVEVSKDFMMSPNKLNLEVSLDKELYHHGESIAVNVHVSNNSNRTVKKVKVSFRQFADICLFSTAQYKCTVAEIESEDGCPVGPGSTLSKVYSLKPLLADNKDKRGLALDGQLKHEDTNLASSTLLTDASQKENLGIVVQYKVRVKLSLGPLGGDIQAELPVTLMHPKPDSSELDQSQIHRPDSGHKTICRCKRPAVDQQQGPRCEIVYPDSEISAAGGRHRHQHLIQQQQQQQQQQLEDHAAPQPVNSQNQEQKQMEEQQQEDLIQLDDENDIIFEDFARMKLKMAEEDMAASAEEDMAATMDMV